MADKNDVVFNAEHEPKDKAIEAFQVVEAQIKKEIIASRHHWDDHDVPMWSRAGTISDKDLTNFNISEDLVSVRAGPTTYGVILLGKIRLPKVPKITVGGRESDGFVHVRIHDPPNRGTEDVTFHSLWTDEGKRDENGRAEHYIAIQTDDVPLEFFNE